jgi:hypothetical protein
VLALKGNHPLLYEEVKNFFAEAQGPKFRELYSINNFTKKEKGHGRIECREYYITSQLKWLDARKDWKQLTSIGMAVDHSEKAGVKTSETRYFLCSIAADLEKFAYAVRRHWGIESMHCSVQYKT